MNQLSLEEVINRKADEVRVLTNVETFKQFLEVDEVFQKIGKVREFTNDKNEVVRCSIIFFLNEEGLKLLPIELFKGFSVEDLPLKFKPVNKIYNYYIDFFDNYFEELIEKYFSLFSSELDLSVVFNYDLSGGRKVINKFIKSLQK